MQGLYILVTRSIIMNDTCGSPEGCAGVRDEFSYFTVLTYWGLLFYFLFAALHTLTYAVKGQPLIHRFPRPLKALHALFYSTVVTYPFLVTIVYWAILYEDPWYAETFDAWKEVSQHAVNSFFALFELVVPRTEPLPWIHAFWLVVILALYLALAYITYATKGFYPYSFLDPGPDGPGGRGWVAVYCVIILVATLVIFLVVRYLILLRVWVTESKMGMHGKTVAMKPRRRNDIELGAMPK